VEPKLGVHPESQLPFNEHSRQYEVHYLDKNKGEFSVGSVRTGIFFGTGVSEVSQERYRPSMWQESQRLPDAIAICQTLAACRGLPGSLMGSGGLAVHIFDQRDGRDMLR
jgi:hypothetical protein